MKTGIKPKTRTTIDRAIPALRSSSSIPSHPSSSLQLSSLSLSQLADAVRACRRCPRLARHHARLKRADPAAYCLPVPGDGPATARLWILGLAPGARGAGTTGVPFTRDPSGRFLRAALARAGLDDSEGGDVFISNAARCVPPANRPTPQELRRCAPFLLREWTLLSAPTLLCLGATAWRAAQLTALAAAPTEPRPPLTPFSHGATLTLPTPTHPSRRLLASYHVSPLNVNTHRLTPAMFDAILSLALTPPAP